MSRYVLVHGAWEGAWSWENIVPALESRGHEVVVVKLPGSYGNEKPIGEVTLESYVAEVEKVIEASDQRVVLAGHSLGGVVISQLGERLADRIERLVYVTAFLLENGGSAIEAMQSDVDGQMLSKLVFSEDQSYAQVPEDVWREVAFHDAAAKDIDSALSRTAKKQATEPFMAKLKLTGEQFGRVPKSYIRTTLDRVLSPALQDRMIQNWTVDEVVTLESGHFPALSMPEKLASSLLVIGAGARSA
ncbi:MAG: alpha/beta fold hydrolase [Phycisphaerales bacterium]